MIQVGTKLVCIKDDNSETTNYTKGKVYEVTSFDSDNTLRITSNRTYKPYMHINSVGSMYDLDKWFAPHQQIYLGGE